jgi:hypothetical protein
MRDGAEGAGAALAGGFNMRFCVPIGMERVYKSLEAVSMRRGNARAHRMRIDKGRTQRLI